MHTLTKNLLLAVAIVVLLVYLTQNFSSIWRGSDFPAHWSAARMVREGHGHLLYEPGAQPDYQLRYLGQMGAYHTHPAFEMLILVPLAYLPLRQAYVLWCMLSLGLLVVSARLLASHVFPIVDWRGMLLLSFVFIPVLLNFMQGQDLALFLLLLTLTLVAIKQGRDFPGGCVLACGLFRFHLILPLALLLILKKRRFFGGFVMVGGALVLVSMAISGWTFPIAYPKFLVHLADFAPMTNRPQGMPTLRGLVAVLLPFVSFRLAVIVASSLLIVGLALRTWLQASKSDIDKSGELSELALANAITAGILVGYSVNPHDLTIALIPMLCLIRHLRSTAVDSKALRIGAVTLLIVLFLPPLHLWLLRVGMYVWAAVPVLLLFLLTDLEIRMGLAELSANRQYRAPVT